jgi:hypothetical protein
MTRLTALWQALENVPGLVTTKPYWKLHCGSDYSVGCLFLNATEDQGGVHPCGHAKDDGCCRQIVEFGDGFIAICRQEWEPCPELSLCADDTVLYEFDLGSFIGSLSDWIGVNRQRLDHDGHGPWVVGRVPDGQGSDRTVFLIIKSDLTGFADAARKVVVHPDGRKAILAPTNRFSVDTEVVNLLQQHRIPAYSLEDLLLKRDDGIILCPNSLADIISGKVIRATALPKGKNGRGRGFAANALHNRKVAAVIAEIGEGWIKRLPYVCMELHRVEADLPNYWRAQQVGTWAEVADLVTEPGKAADREKVSQQIRYCLRWVMKHPAELV